MFSSGPRGGLPTHRERRDDSRAPRLRPRAASASINLRRDPDSAYLITLAAAFSITIVRLPFYFENQAALQPLIAGFFLLCLGWAVPRQTRGAFANHRAAIVFAYVAVVAFALFRGARSGAYGSTLSAVGQSLTYVLVAALGIVLVTTARDRHERDSRLIAIALAPAIYVLVNSLMQLGGLENPDPGGVSAGRPAAVLQILGASGVRAKFPMSTSINLFSIVAAVGLVVAVVLRSRVPERVPRRVAWPIALASTYCLLLGDSRGAIAITAAVIALFLATRRGLPARVLALLLPLLPLLVLTLIGFLANSGLNDALSRGGGFGEVATATGRLYIWDACWDVLKHPDIQQLFGWGAAGHIPSGASTHYAFVFPRNPDATSIFTHNIVLQSILDTGYVGLAVLVAAVWSTGVALEREITSDPRSPVAALLASLTVVLLSGATEVSPTYYSQEALLSVLLIMGAAAGLSSNSRRSPIAAIAHPPSSEVSDLPGVNAPRFVRS